MPSDTAGRPRGVAEPITVDTATGRLQPARWHPSPHWDARPEGCAIELVVVHGISLPPGEFGGPWIDRLFDGSLEPSDHPGLAHLEGLRVSAHLLVDRAGAITQYVPLHGRAWHAGASSWRGRPACNDFSVGVELEGTDTLPYEPAQYRALAGILAALSAAYPALGRDAVAGHSDIAPGRKSDPGPAFDWERLYRELAALRAG